MNRYLPLNSIILNTTRELLMFLASRLPRPAKEDLRFKNLAKKTTNFTLGNKNILTSVERCVNRRKEPTGYKIELKKRFRPSHPSSGHRLDSPEIRHSCLRSGTLASNIQAGFYSPTPVLTCSANVLRSLKIFFISNMILF
jgi:hypothetical protein